MSHVDEGTLHAYLDGALDSLPATEAQRVRRHLAECDVCQARLEEERAVRDEAASILGGASVRLDELPSFEEVRARAGAGSPRTAGGTGLRRLGWAASVAVALGSGWLLRGGVPRPGVPAETEAVGTTMSAESSEEAPPLGPPGRASEVVREAPVPVSVVAEQERSSPGATPPPPPGVASKAASATLAPDRQEGVGAGRAAESRPDVDALSDVSAVAPTPAEVWADRVRQRQQAAGSSGLGLPSVTGVAPGLDPSTKQLGRDMQGTATRRVANSVLSADAASAGEGPPQTGTGTLVVPGLSVVSVTWMDEPGLDGAVRVLQRLENGDTLELLHLPPGSVPASLSPPDDGRTQVVLPRGGGWLVGRAYRSADQLRSLLDRLGDTM